MRVRVFYIMGVVFLSRSMEVCRSRVRLGSSKAGAEYLGQVAGIQALCFRHWY